MSNTGRVPDGGAADSSLLKRVVDLADAIVTPTVFDESSHSYSGCVHDCLGRVVPESQRTSTHEWRTSDPEVLVPPEGIEELEGIGLYLGHYTRAYGHFLLETLSRVWGIGAGIPYDKVIFQPWWLDLGGSPLEPTPQARTCFDCLGIRRDQIVVANRHLRLKRLFVPSPLFRIGGGDGFAFAMHGDQSEVFQKIIQHCTCGRRLVAWRDWRWRSPWKFRGRVWLSRAQLTSHHRPAISNEEEIERVFRSHGFQVVCPEKLPFERQVALYHGADIIAGIAGSAMHNSIFMRPGTTALTIHSAREHQQELKGGPVGRIQELCDEVARVRHRVIKFRGTITDPEKPIARFDIRYLKAELPKVLLS